MLRLDAPRSVSFCDGLTRRDFLRAAIDQSSARPIRLLFPDGEQFVRLRREFRRDANCPARTIHLATGRARNLTPRWIPLSRWMTAW